MGMDLGYQYPKYGKAMGCVWISVPLAAPCANQRASDTACTAERIVRSPLLLLGRKTLHVLPRMPRTFLPRGSHKYCTVPYPGVDKVKVKINVNVKVKVNIRGRLGEATPSASITKARRRQEEASPR